MVKLCNRKVAGSIPAEGINSVFFLTLFFFCFQAALDRNASDRLRLLCDGTVQ